MPEDEEAFKRKLDDMAAQVNEGANPFVGMHVVLVQMLEAGFTQSQACTIIGTWIGYQSGGNQ